MTEKNQKYQIIKFDSFDFLIILMLKKFLKTDRQTDRQTFGPIEATYHRLKKLGSTSRHEKLIQTKIEKLTFMSLEVIKEEITFFF